MAKRRVGRGVVWLVALTAAVLALGRGGVAGQQASDKAPARPRTTAEHVAQLPSAPPPPFHLPDVSAEPEPLPEASIQEAFEIGEALYDEARVPVAVVSLLSKMGIPILPDGAGASPPANGVRLDASEVRALIALATDDLASTTDIENLPFTFADLHAALAPMLPGQSVEALADAYSRAYAENEGALVAKVMMGQPITPETRLTRAHIWLLVMDGFASPGGAAAWGTADRVLPDLRSPNPQWSPAEWKEVLARLPLVGADRVLAIEAPATITQGSAPVSIAARLTPQAPPLVSRITGKILLAPGKGSLTGQAITWDVAEDSVLRDVGAIGTPTGEAQPFGSDGVARLRYVPAADTSKGQGQAMEEWADVAGTLEARPLLASAYTVPSAAGNLVFGTTRVTKRVRVAWRSTDTYVLMLSNLYRDVEVIVPPFGKGSRSGTDSIVGYFAKRRGVYRAVLEVHSDSTMQVPSPDCKSSSIDAQQLLLVVGRPVDGFGPAHTLANYAWLEAGQEVQSMQAEPPVGYMALDFYPVTAPQPRFAGAKAFDKCQPRIPAAPSQRGHGATAFQPLNDARWTIPGSGYVVALARDGRKTYIERTMDNASPSPGGTPNYGPKIADAKTPSWVGVFARGYSEWLVWMRRP